MKTTELDAPPKGRIPRYVLQPHIISWASHNLSATAIKITYMAMALLPFSLSTLTAAFTFMDFCEALGYDNGEEPYQEFKEAVKECMKPITVKNPPGMGEEITKVIPHWFQDATFDEETGVCTMTLNPELADFLRKYVNHGQKAPTARRKRPTSPDKTDPHLRDEIHPGEKIFDK